MGQGVPRPAHRSPLIRSLGPSWGGDRARAGQATLLAVAMHGLSNDVARIGGLVDGPTRQVSAISELNLAAPFIVLALVLVAYAKRQGWGDLRGLPDCSGR